MVQRTFTFAAATALLLALVLLVGACSDPDANGERETGLWFAFPEATLGREGPIRLVHVDSGAEEQVGAPGVYRNIAWAPGGRHLAAIHDLPQPELVVFSLFDDEDHSVQIPAEIGHAQLSWSPDGTRLLLFSANRIRVYSPELEPLSEAFPPEGAEPPIEFSPGVWNQESSRFGAALGGFLVIVDRVGRTTYYDPADFVRDPEGTLSLTVTNWEASHAVAVFEESSEHGPRRYVLEVDGEDLEVLSSSDFEAGAGPFDGLLQQASDAAGGSDVLLGQSSSPPALRWVVALPGPGDVPTRVFVRQGDIFLTASTGLFAGVDPHDLVADLSVMLRTGEED